MKGIDEVVPCLALVYLHLQTNMRERANDCVHPEACMKKDVPEEHLSIDAPCGPFPLRVHKQD